MKRKYIEPTDAEEAEINRGIANDPDAWEIPTEVIKRMRPFSELMAKRDDDLQSDENPKRLLPST